MINKNDNYKKNNSGENKKDSRIDNKKEKPKNSGVHNKKSEYRSNKNTKYSSSKDSYDNKRDNDYARSFNGIRKNIKVKETVQDIKNDNIRIEKEIHLEIKEFSNIKMGF